MSVFVQAFLLCKAVVIQKGSRLADVNSVFDSISGATFPVILEGCALFIRLLVWDESKCSVAVASKSPMLAKQLIMKPIVVKPDPNGRIQLTHQINRLIIEEEGVYTLQLRLNQVTHSELHLIAYRQRAPVRCSPRDAEPEAPE